MSKLAYGNDTEVHDREAMRFCTGARDCESGLIQGVKRD